MDDAYFISAVVYVVILSGVFALMPTDFFVDASNPANTITQESLASQTDVDVEASAIVQAAKQYNVFQKIVIGLFGTVTVDNIPIYISLPLTVINVIIFLIAIIYLIKTAQGFIP